MYGGDMLYKDYQYGGGRNNNRVIFKQTKKPLSTFAILNFFLAQNLGSNPFILEKFYNIGLVNILVAGLFAWFLCQLSFNIFIRTWHYDSETSYAECLAESLGKPMRVITRILNIFSMSNTILYDVSDVYILWNLFIRHFYQGESIFTDKKFVLYVFILAFSIPFLFVRQFSSLKWLAYISNIVFIGSIIPCITHMIDSIKERGFNPYGTTVLASTNFGDTVNCFSVFVFQFYIHPIMCNLAPQCSEVTQGGILKVTYISNFVSFLANFVIGYINWFALFGSGNGGIPYLKWEKSYLIAFGSICCLFHTLVSIVMTSYLVGIEITKLFVGDISTYFPNAYGALVVILLMIASNILPYVTIAIVGSLCQASFLLCGLFWPVIAYLKIFGAKSFFGILSVIMLGVLTVGGVTVLYSVFVRPSDR